MDRTEYLYELVVRFFNETENKYRIMCDDKDNGSGISDSAIANIKTIYEDLHGAIALYERYGDVSGLKVVVDKYIKKEEIN